MKRKLFNTLLTLAGAVTLLTGYASSKDATSQAEKNSPTLAEARAIAKEAYIYGYPLVDNYRAQYAYYVDKNNPNFKSPWNHIKSVSNVYTPADIAV